MYQFPEDMKKAYESSPLSFVYYQNLEGKAVPVLASGGFCKSARVSRERVLDWISAGMFERMDPDDVGIMAKISEDFLLKRGPYDVVFRCNVDPSDGNQEAEAGHAVNMMLHGVGRWQTMPDGTELAVISYANLLATQEVTKERIEAYTLFQKDRFYTDPLTGLPNINYINEYGNGKIDAIRAGGHTPGVVYVDVNGMQFYNNQYGVKEGDRLLKLIAETMEKKLPKALISRTIDDHFVVITELDDKEIMEAQLSELNSFICKNARGNTTGIRSGVCLMTENTELTEALDHAKRAMKRIENNMNREVAFFSKAEDSVYWKNRYVIENFDRAMKQGWIKVFYHSLVRLGNVKIAAFEGLARWLDPNRGTISPGEFIPVLSKYHLLHKLDLYMFEQICREVKLRHDNGLPLLPVSVNFSRQDFDHADIVAEMNRLFKKYGLEAYVDKSCFIVEITEQDLAVGTDRLKDQIRQIRDEGYRIWLDDFGSGYSSLNMFSQFDFNLVKFDMELLRHLDEHDGVNRIILKDLVNMVRELGIHTLVEGLETEEQFDFLKKIGCELAQGFLFHKPEPLDEALYRINAGDSVKICETPEEREAMNRLYFQKS